MSTKAPPNNFNIMRLVAAWMILFGHCYNLYDHSSDPINTLLGLPGSAFYALACFFTISGYLVTASWVRQPNIKHYALNRLLRILPGLACVMLLCTLVLGPLVTSLPTGEYFRSPDTWKYLRGIFVFGLRYDLPGVFGSVPYANVVNGSLWSLKLEVQLYIALAVLASLRLLRPKIVSLLAFACLAGNAALGYFPAESHPYILGVKYGNLTNFTLWGFFFAAGSSLSLNRDNVMVSTGSLVAACILSFGGYYLLPHGYYLHALMLPYIILSIALFLPALPWRVIRENDLSYGIYLYAFPIQQTYLLLVGTRFGMTGFILVSTFFTLIAAWLSWRLVESKALALKHARRKTETPASQT